MSLSNQRPSLIGENGVSKNTGPNINEHQKPGRKRINKEIRDLISDSVEKVNTGGRLVNESGETLSEIVGAVQKVNTIISEIAASSKEQSSALGSINVAVTELDEITQQNAALAEEASAASESSLDKATEMTQLVGFFKVNS